MVLAIYANKLSTVTLSLANDWADNNHDRSTLRAEVASAVGANLAL